MPRRLATSTLSVLGVLGLAIGIGTMAGCLPGTNPGGHAWSLDKHVYASTVWEPKTVIVTDTASGETLWVKEVPVGKQVVVRFFKGEARGDDPRRPDSMAWGMARINKAADDWEERIDVPGAEWRMISFELRPAPEYPRTPAPVAEPPPLEPAEGGSGENR